MSGDAAPDVSPSLAENPEDFASLLEGEIGKQEYVEEQDGKETTKDDGVLMAASIIAERALEDETLVSDYALDTLESLRKALDDCLTRQVNGILHHAEFQKLEGTWRGLYHLVNNTETDEMLQIRVMNISKKDLKGTLKKHKGVRWDQSPIFRKVYEEGYGILGGSPFACLVGDYEFNHKAEDLMMLQELASIAASSHAPFISAASPSVLKMDSWQELDQPWQLAKQFTTPDFAGWKSLREHPDACYLGLTMPRFLARLPYGAETEPVEGFDFEEETGNGKHDKYTWANAAYAMGVNIADAFKRYGWCARIRGVQSGGEFTGLFCHTFPTDDGGVELKCPTEIAITDRREKELADCGFIPLCHRVGTDRAAFIGAQSVNRPLVFREPEVQASANLSARLPYMFACCRIAHYLKAMCRDWVGKYTSREALEKDLNEWINQYVMVNIVGKSQKEMAKKPLQDAQVTVQDVAGNPGYYNATFQLRPHYQLEGIDVNLTLVSEVKR